MSDFYVPFDHWHKSEETGEPIQEIDLKRYDHISPLALLKPINRLRESMSVQQLVTDFNHLTRQETSPNGIVKNVWNISVRHVPVQPGSDVLFLVVNNGEFVHAAGPARLLHITNSSERAEIILPMLLKSFTSSFGTDVAPIAPWSWSIRERMLSQSLELAFQAVGLRKDLQKIRVATDEENAVADREWIKFRDTLLKTVATPPGERPPLPGRRRSF